MVVTVWINCQRIHRLTQGGDLSCVQHGRKKGKAVIAHSTYVTFHIGLRFQR